MSHPLSELEPQVLFNHFYEITQIPRPSKKEEGVRRYLRKVALESGANFEQDAIGNVLLTVASTRGFEKHKTLVIQSHMDMVCEKTPQSSHNFEKDPIELRIKGDRLYAKDTTLGADNGIGMSTALALLTDPKVEHGPLELVFTIDEESGMTGVKNLSFPSMKGKIMLNLDSEETGTLTLGCAGGGDFVSTLQVKRLSVGTLSTYELTLGGLRGGHSGVQIHEGRVNAIKYLVDILASIGGFELYSIDGGNLRNAIPRDARVVLGLSETQKKNLESAISQKLKDLRQIETEAVCDLKPKKKEFGPIDPGQGSAILEVIRETVSGVIDWSQEIPDLVRTSNNLGVIRTTESTVQITSLARSLATLELEKTLEKLTMLYRSVGFQTCVESLYPGWDPDFKSLLLKKCQDVHRRIFGVEAKRIVIHAGLECGIFKEKAPDMDMIAFGPMIYDAHSPNENLEISSVKPFWKFVCGLVTEVTKP